MGLGFWEWASIIAIWFVAAAIVVYVDVWIIERRIRKIMEQYKQDTQQHIHFGEEVLGLQTRAGKKLPAWLEKIDEGLKDTK